jgi:hypothetical protein
MENGRAHLNRGQQRRVAAQLVKDKAEKGKIFEETRKLLSEARKFFQDAFTRSKARFKEAKVPEAPESNI